MKKVKVIIAISILVISSMLFVACKVKQSENVTEDSKVIEEENKVFSNEGNMSPDEMEKALEKTN